MPGKHLFEYAIVRVVPRVEREEFVNIGVILYCGDFRFLKTRIAFHEQRIKDLCPDVALEALKEHIRSFQDICAGNAGGGPLGKLPLAERFRWLTATRSTVLQTSPVHPGLCADAEATLERLFQQMVL